MRVGIPKEIKDHEYRVKFEWRVQYDQTFILFWSIYFGHRKRFH